MSSKSALELIHISFIFIIHTHNTSRQQYYNCWFSLIFNKFEPVFSKFQQNQKSTFVEESGGGDMNRDLDDPNVSFTNCSGDGAVLLVLSTFVDISIEFFLDRVVGLLSTDSANKHQISQKDYIQFSPIISALLHNYNSYTCTWAIVSHLSINEYNSNFKEHFFQKMGLY